MDRHFRLTVFILTLRILNLLRGEGKVASWPAGVRARAQHPEGDGDAEKV
jgi:hypothetical protein